MRKLFTSVVAALCLAAPMSTLSAQNTQQLTEAQKEAIKKEVLPVVFEQIKEQAGIDILGWANPKLSDTFAGIPVLESTDLFRSASTRAAQTISVQPDRIEVNLGIIDPALSTMGNAVITFGDYDTKNITVGETTLSINMPATITITALNGMLQFATINIDSEVGSMMGLPFSMDVNMTSELLGLDNTDVVACSLAINGTNLEANVDIQEGLSALLEGATTDYLVTVGLSQLGEGIIPAHLYAVSATSRAPMGDAVVTLNLQNTMMPVQKIDVTGYSYEGTTPTTKLSLLEFDASQTTSSNATLTTTVTIDNSSITPDVNNEEERDTTLVNRTIVAMSDYTASLPTTAQAAVQSVVKRVVNELATNGKATWYEMSISQQQATNGTLSGEAVNIATITVSPYVSGTDAIADVNVEVGNDTYTITATADLAGSNEISVGVVKAATETEAAILYGTAYFTSNIAGVITANESVEESVATMKVVPTQNAIRVTNVDKGTYRIVSMTGAVVASGHINGDTYIPTASLAQGIYIVAVEANGTLQSVKVKL